MKFFSSIFLLTFAFSPFCSYSENSQSKIDSLQSCLKVAKDDSTKATILREIGLVYVNNGNYPKGIEMLLKSKDLFQSIKNEYGVFRCECNLGVAYCYMGDYKTSLDYLLHTKKGFEDGLIYDNLGLVYYNENDISKALSYWKMALKFYKEKSDSKLVARLLNDIGSMYELQDKSDSAIFYYNECLRTSNDKMNLSGAYASLGDIYFRKGNYLQSLEYENKSLKLAREINDLISMRETEKMLSDIYLKLNDCSTSLIHYKNYIAIKDSLVNEDNIKQIVRVEENFKFEKEKEHAKAEQDKKDIVTAQEKKRQRIIIYSVSIGLFLVLLLALFIFRSYKQKKKDNIEISEQKKLVDEKNKDILDSIRYASRIQKAIMLPDNLIQNILSDYFLLWKSRDAVSGDFYFIEQYGNKIIIAIADATGHGTNGCLISILGSNILSEIVKEGETVPSKILDKLNKRFNTALHKSTDDSIRDGMDISLICLDTTNNTAMWAGANNPLWIMRSGEIIEMKADKLAIGQTYKEAEYTNHEIQLQKEDMLYAFSDGMCDQFNPDGKKFMKKRLRELLISVQNNNMPVQKEIINSTIERWKQSSEQTDDILIMGIKI